MKNDLVSFIEKHCDKITFCRNGCWEWNASTAGKMSYGSAWCPESQGMKRAHRLAFEAAFGEIPNGKIACHTCDNPKCCNPHHIFIGSQKENIADMWRKGRAKQQLAGADK